MAKAVKAQSAKKSKGTAVLIGTNTRNLWYGFATDTRGDAVKLKKARQVIYWSSDMKGAGGLAVTGPSKGCRIGPEVSEVEVRGVTAVAKVSARAINRFNKAPWGN